MFKFLVNIYVSLFVKKSERAYVKYRILGFPNRFHVKKKAAAVGKHLDCTGQYPCTVNKKTTIGDYVTMNGVVVQGSGEVSIGSYIHFGSETMILSDSHNYEGEFLPFDDTVTAKKVTIGDFSWIGSRVVILPGTTIGEGAIIQAGSVVHGQIPPCSIAGGNSAKVFKMRDIEHFNKLKEDKKFYIRGK